MMSMCRPRCLRGQFICEPAAERKCPVRRTPNTNLRAGYGRGIARPNFSDLPPYILETDSGNPPQVAVGNPALKPTFGQQFRPAGGAILEAGRPHPGRRVLQGAQRSYFSRAEPDHFGQFAGFTQFQPTTERRLTYLARGGRTSNSLPSCLGS